jgi:hypothetical protein
MESFQLTTAAKREKLIETAIKAVELDLADVRFSDALGQFRKAVNLSRGFPELEKKVVAVAAEQAAQLTPHTWLVAKALLDEAADLESQARVQPERDTPVIRLEPLRAPSVLQPQTIDRLKSLATVLFAAAALTVAGVLVWTHKVQRVPVRLIQTSADDAAWSAINHDDLDSVEAYLLNHPTGVNRDKAVLALANIRVARRQAAEAKRDARSPVQSAKPNP